MTRILFALLIALGACAFAPAYVFAAEIYFGSHGKEVGTGQYAEVGVFLNTEEESVNALEGAVEYPSTLLTPQEVRRGSSLISFWIEEPHVEQGVIRFSGVIPGGYTGSGPLFSLVFKAEQNEGKAVIDVKGGQALLNDGNGTPTSFRTAPLVLSIGAALEGPEVLPVYDPDPPEPFTPELAQDPNMFEGKWFVVFATQDKGSGIDHYEIQELKRWRVAFGNLFKSDPDSYRRAESPYVLQDQTLKEYAYIKAVDKSGNERVVIVAPQSALPWYATWWKFGILLVLLSIVYFVFRLYGGRRRYTAP